VYISCRNNKDENIFFVFVLFFAFMFTHVCDRIVDTYFTNNIQKLTQRTIIIDIKIKILNHSISTVKPRFKTTRN